MQSPCLRHTYLFSHLFAIPPTCFPLIVVPSLPPPCPCRIHTLRRVGVVGLHQGVCPTPPPPRGDAAMVFAPLSPPGMPPACLSRRTPPRGCRQGVCPILPPPPPPPPAASRIAPFDAPLRPVAAVICAAAPPPPPPSPGTHLFSVPGGRWHIPLAPPAHNHLFVAANNSIHPTESPLSRLARSLSAH